VSKVQEAKLDSVAIDFGDTILVLRRGKHPMVRQFLSTLLFSTSALFAQTQSPVAPKSNLTPLFNHIWRITSATPYPHSSSIYIFQPGGTLLETSCVETYRVATWKAVPGKPDTLEVTEDGRTAFSATVLAIDDTALRLRQTLAFGDHAVKEVTLSAIQKEFVCPDMPK